MLCELCGKEVPFTKQVAIEGTMLTVCKDCSKFGVEPGVVGKKGTPMPTSVKDRLEARKRRMQQRDIYSDEVLDLAQNYADKIRSGRRQKGIRQSHQVQGTGRRKVSRLRNAPQEPREHDSRHR